MRHEWRAEDGAVHELALVRVPGTGTKPYLFGAGANRTPVDIGDFAIGATQVTQALWQHVMGGNPAKKPDPRRPIENVSWHHVTDRGGFLDRINASPVLAAVAGGDSSLRFRLPTEAEWEYAARGGPRWQDDFAFSGSNDPDAVAWYGPRWNRFDEALMRVFGWPRGWRLANHIRPKRHKETHPVASKEPNQLGVYDMSGNVWEWCQDECNDGERRLRGGCFDNWDLHCRVWWRYGITPDAHDGCIGFRLALARSA
jgi:formylglycine-generating enzyme required for sulfatase activity